MRRRSMLNVSVRSHTIKASTEHVGYSGGGSRSSGRLGGPGSTSPITAAGQGANTAPMDSLAWLAILEAVGEELPVAYIARREALWAAFADSRPGGPA